MSVNFFIVAIVPVKTAHVSVGKHGFVIVDYATEFDSAPA